MMFATPHVGRSAGRVRSARFVARIAIVLVALLAVCPTNLISAGELSAEQRETIDAAVEQLMQEKKVPGLSLAVAVDGELAYERGYGLTDVENNVAATPQSVYRLASISKMLTGTAAMQLVEQGKLDLDAPIQKYVPTFPEKRGTITAELLLKHQSGIRHYKGDEVRSAVFYNRVGDALAIFQDDPLMFEPGDRFLYTTYGFNLLGTAIEGASGESYVDYVTEHVFKPAGITTIQPDNPYKIIPNRAAGYRMHGFGASATLRNDDRVDVTNKIPGGGWCGTSGDLVRFAIAICDGKLLRPATLEEVWTPQKTADGRQTTSGLGCFVLDRDGQRRIYHSGGQPKVSTFLVFAPEEKAAVALMCNLRRAGLSDLANQLLDELAPPDSEAD